MFWPKFTADKINKTVTEALSKNVNYRNSSILGLPATFLDSDVFYDDAPFLENAPFLSTLIANPNHIGCHTLVGAEKIFKGTQALELDLIKLCSEQIFRGDEDAQDGYIASGGTEANIEALWIYRNYFVEEFGAKMNEIGVIYSEDSHYSFSKGINLLNIESLVAKVNPENRAIDLEALNVQIDAAQSNGIKYFIIIMNMSTTMFGSVDDIDEVTRLITAKNINFKLHVDGAFGGFIYPFTNQKSAFTFQNKHISSITIDAHKMLQTPYGTGIFLVRKGLMKYVKTSEAQYVPGTDHTLCGSRSGANAVAVWMVLHTHGSAGWTAKMQMLNDKTTDICCQLDQLGIHYYRNPFINIIAIHAEEIPEKVAKKYFLVADSYENKPKWWKIVMMPHITRGAVDSFIIDLKSEMVLAKN